MKKGVHEGDEGTEALEVTCSGLVTVEPMWPEIYVATKLVATSLLSFLESSGISFLPLFLRVRFPWGKNPATVCQMSRKEERISHLSGG